jgi:hypothetical protein
MFKPVFVGAIALFLSACATPSRFEWGGYEGALYAYAKTPEARETYRKSLQDAIEAGERTERVAPGMYAELGYLFVEDDNNADAIASFQKEMALFPESRPFLSSVVQRLSGSAATNAGAPTS